MGRLERILEMLEHALNTKDKRHLAGGVLMSLSLFFGCLAVTVLLMKMEEQKHEQ